ncbi:BON domain protein [Stieleria neptunia]|uniref:BON domain protein n=1 Tax=Stieleria neptunia TaxID=2527979 RepID=A0A518HX38_9BACT|nr:BON domain protein [Stieleria neptunia]
MQRVVEVHDFSCSIDDGTVTLRGQVESRDDAMMCIVVARSVPGVESIVSDIKVLV